MADVSVVVVTAPEPVVSLAEAKAHLRVDGDADDALITALVEAATGHLDGPYGVLGRAVGVQTLLATFDRPWASYRVLDLPLPPLVDVLEVTDLTPSTPAVLEAGTWVGTANGLRSLALPSTLRRFSVKYGAGFAAVPAALKAAILLLVGDFYSNREAP